MENKIHPKKIYTANEIFENGFIYWIHSLATLTRWIRRDMVERNFLKTARVGSGITSRYFIRGDHLIEFIAAFEDGTLSGREVNNMSDENTTQNPDTEAEQPAPQQEPVTTNPQGE